MPNEYPRPAVYTPPRKYEKMCKIQLWNEKQNRTLFLGHPIQIANYVKQMMKVFKIVLPSINICAVYAKVNLIIGHDCVERKFQLIKEKFIA